MLGLEKGALTNNLDTAWEIGVGDHIIRALWSPDGRSVAVACVSGPIHLLDSANGSTLRTFAGHKLGTQSLSWSPDGMYLASAGQDGKAKIWRPDSEFPVRELEAGAPWVEEVAFAPSGQVLATAAGKNLKLWDVNGELAQSWRSHPSTIAAIEWQRQGLFLSSACYGQLATFKPTSANPVKAFAWKGSILTLAWSPSGDYVATGNQDASVHFWYRKSGKDLEMSGYPTKVRELSWDSSSRYLATGGSAVVIVWDCGGKGPAGTRPIQLEAHDTLLTALAYQNRGGLLASGCQDGLMCIWDPVSKRKKHLQSTRLTGSVTQLRWSPDDFALLATSSDGVVRLLAGEGAGYSK